MRSVIILLSVFLMIWPNKVNADDGCPLGCDVLYSVFVGAPTALTSTIFFPLVGRANFDGENPPYWRAAGYTLVASSVGVWIAFKRYDSRDENSREFVGFPLLFGAVATYLTYRYAPRGTDKTSSLLWQYAPKVSVSPVARGGSIRLNWSF